MIWDLREAIKEMGHIQMSYKAVKSNSSGGFSISVKEIELSEKDIDKIMAFFKALEGRKPKIVYPELPKSTAKTLKPDEK